MTPHVVALSFANDDLFGFARHVYSDVPIPVIDMEIFEYVMKDHLLVNPSSKMRAEYLKSELNELSKQVPVVVVLGIKDDADALAIDQHFEEKAKIKHYHLTNEKEGPDTTFINFLLFPPSIVYYVNEFSCKEMLSNFITN